MNLEVKIPKRFKESLDYRFNPENAKKDEESKVYYIAQSCPLCKEFLDCKGCPLWFDSEHGCFSWLGEVIGEGLYFCISIYWITWDEDRDKEARKQLMTLRERAKELITWED